MPDRLCKVVGSFGGEHMARLAVYGEFLEEVREQQRHVWFRANSRLRLRR